MCGLCGFLDLHGEGNSETTQATLQLAEADLRAAEAALQGAKVPLGFTRITAPISGRIGRSSVTRGALVTRPRYGRSLSPGSVMTGASDSRESATCPSGVVPPNTAVPPCLVVPSGVNTVPLKLSSTPSPRAAGLAATLSASRRFPGPSGSGSSDGRTPQVSTTGVSPS